LVCAKASVHFARFAVSMLIGALGALGRPGIDATPLYFASEVALCARALAAESPFIACEVGLGWGLGLFFAIALGTLSWGVVVPLTLTAIGVALYALPLALWCWFAAQALEPRWLIPATVCAWSLCLDFGDWLGFPLKESAESLVVSVPMLAAGARLVGANMLSGLLTATAVALAEAWLRTQKAPLAARMIALLPRLVVGIGCVAVLATLADLTAGAPGRSVWVGVPQINAGGDYYASRLLRPDLARAFDERFARQLNDLRGMDVLVTTEGFDGRYDITLPTLRERWQEYGRSHAQNLAITSYTVEPNGWKGNAVLGISRQGKLVGIHRKVDLALHGERMLARGAGYEVFELEPDLTLGVPLCLESVLPRAPHVMTREGATLLAVSTSDITFGSNLTAFAHLAVTQLRAIETGRSIIWASNGGPSGVIDRWGMFESGAPFREAAVARMKATLHADATFYLEHARAVSLVCALGLLLVLLSARQRSEMKASVIIRASVSSESNAPRAILLAVASVVGAIGVAVISPVLVEYSRGNPARAGSAVAEGFRPARFQVPNDAFSRFRAPASESAKGAIAYFLSYYGLDATVGELPAGLPDAPELADVRRYLETTWRVPTQELTVDPSALPRVPAIVRALDGSYVVLYDTAGDGRPNAFLPSTGFNVSVDPAAVTHSFATAAIVPR
jgi:apolipoprotein N-acyltransferase